MKKVLVDCEVYFSHHCSCGIIVKSISYRYMDNLIPEDNEMHITSLRPGVAGLNHLTEKENFEMYINAVLYINMQVLLIFYVTLF